jgi:two-component system chemotaxis response regulator CheB
VTLRIRVLVVDDAVIVRRLIMQALSTDPAFEIVGSASDGAIALERIAALNPDIVTLDLDMPDVDGISALREIRPRWPRLPVLVFTGMANPGPREMEALSLGAAGAIRKLPHEGNMRDAIRWVRDQLAPALKNLSAPSAAVTPVATAHARSGDPAGAGSRVDRRSARRPEVLGIGASTGGPNALEEVLRNLPADLDLPIVVVQHMPEGFTRLLADRLAATTPFPASEAIPGTVLQPGRIWVAPGDRHMLVERCAEGVRLETNRHAPEHSCRPAVDVLFRSLAEAYGPAVLAVVLTGMGQDGLLGAERIVQAGGEVVVQDEETSVVWGMPGAVERAGLAAAVLPLGRLADAITERVRGGRMLATRA